MELEGGREGGGGLGYLRDWKSGLDCSTGIVVPLEQRCSGVYCKVTRSVIFREVRLTAL